MAGSFLKMVKPTKGCLLLQGSLRRDAGPAHFVNPGVASDVRLAEGFCIHKGYATKRPNVTRKPCGTTKIDQCSQFHGDLGLMFLFKKKKRIDYIEADLGRPAALAAFAVLFFVNLNEELLHYFAGSFPAIHAPKCAIALAAICGAWLVAICGWWFSCYLWLTSTIHLSCTFQQSPGSCFHWAVHVAFSQQTQGHLLGKPGSRFHATDFVLRPLVCNTCCQCAQGHWVLGARLAWKTWALS